MSVGLMVVMLVDQMAAMMAERKERNSVVRLVETTVESMVGMKVERMVELSDRE